MKRWTRILVAASMLAVIPFSGCEFFTELLGENASEVEGYEIFDGDYKEVEKSAIQTKILDDEKYTGAMVIQLIQNNLGTEIKREEKTEKAKGKMLGGEMEASSASVLANMEHNTSFKLLREGAAVIAAYQMEGKTENKQSAIDEEAKTSLVLYYEDSAGSYVKNGESTWENFTRIGLEGIADVIANVRDFDLLENMVQAEVSEGITVTYFMYEDEEYTKVKIVQKASRHNFLNEATMHLIFTKEMKFVALHSDGKRIEKQNISQSGEVFVEQTTTEQLLVVSPWSGTITRPTDLPVNAE